jgi:hypothetical protein
MESVKLFFATEVITACLPADRENTTKIDEGKLELSLQTSKKMTPDTSTRS